ncbi:IS110 family transposase [Promineifilum sp.]|uniref:IS110 family transposase n=1 Tax=Promineifilum sp. TaxID=2664178 RepID=UPI0035B34AF7
MPRFIGLDIHKTVVAGCVVDPHGTVCTRLRFPLTRTTLAAWARQLTAEDAVAVEATTNTWAVIALLQETPARLVVSNPLRTRAIATAKIKTDRVDAEVLAQLLRCDYLPPVWIPDAATLAARRLTTRRSRLVAERTRLKNRLHSVLHQLLLPCPVADLFSRAGLAWLTTVELPAAERAAVDADGRLLAAVEQELTALEQSQVVDAAADPRVRLLLTLPGIDVAVATALLAAIGEISRFPTPARLAAYLGLVPSVRQSAQHCYTGHITKQGASHVRWLLVQAAQHLDRHPGPLGAFVRKLQRRKNRNIAIVAAARKLVTLAWHVLRSGEPYRYAVPRATQEKLARLRRRATGQRRQSGPPPGTPRAAAYGTGQRTRGIPALATVYQQEGLPAPGPMPSAESRVLATDPAVHQFVTSLQVSHHRPRARQPALHTAKTDTHGAQPG